MKRMDLYDSGTYKENRNKLSLISQAVIGQRSLLSQTKMNNEIRSQTQNAKKERRLSELEGSYLVNSI